jgi:hypothetical protein
MHPDSKIRLGVMSGGVLVGLGYGVTSNSGVLKTIGWMFVGSIAGFFLASAYINLKN